jgi:anti-anti-sigma factor
LTPGSTVVLYTDGLVERRGEAIDDGLDRLAVAAALRHGLWPDALLPAVLDQTLDGLGPPDDIAVVAARLLPAPLRCSVPARAAQLRGMRDAVAAWAVEDGLDEDVVTNLQLALGEAVANSVEHAYRGLPAGEVRVVLRRCAAGVEAGVADDGVWRPVPDDPGYRGRGLRMIRTLGADVEIDTAGSGTRVRFVVPVPPVVAPSPPAKARPRPAAAPCELVGEGGEGEVRLRLRGDLDLLSVARIRAALLGHVQAGGNITVDLTSVGYLSSAGVGVLVEAAIAAPGRLRIEASGPAARILALTGLDGTLTTDSEPEVAPRPAP